MLSLSSCQHFASQKIKSVSDAPTKRCKEDLVRDTTLFMEAPKKIRSNLMLNQETVEHTLIQNV